MLGAIYKRCKVKTVYGFYFFVSLFFVCLILRIILAKYRLKKWNLKISGKEKINKLKEIAPPTKKKKKYYLNIVSSIKQKNFIFLKISKPPILAFWATLKISRQLFVYVAQIAV